MSFKLTNNGYRYAGQCGVGESVAKPSGATEFIAMVYQDYSGNSKNVVSIPFVNDFQADSYPYIRAGWYTSATTNGDVSIQVGNTDIYFNAMKINGSTVSGATMKLYWK